MIAALGFAALTITGMRAPAASSGTVVSAQVPSATSLDASACAPATDATTLGIVLPGTNAVTGTDCHVVFGSSNDTSSLRLFQQDQYGAGMWRASRGELDTDFNTTGTRQLSLSSGDDYSEKLVLLDDGSMMATNYISSLTTNFETTRWTRAGTPDTSWGGTGRVSTDTGTTERAKSIDAGNGRVVVSGHVSDQATIVQYDMLGNLDNDFNGSGRLQLTVGTGAHASVIDDSFDDVMVMDDGRIVATGYAYNTNNDTTIARFTPQGSIDAAFNGGAVRTINTDPGADRGTNVVVLPDDSIVVIGFDSVSNYTIKLLPNGTPDSSYGPGGVARTPGVIGMDAWFDELLVDSAGRLLGVGGAWNGTTYEAIIAQIDPATGTLVPGFGTDGGYTGFDVPSGMVYYALGHVSELDDGRFLAIGWAYDTGWVNEFVATARIHADGTPDFLDGGGNGITLSQPLGATDVFLDAAAGDDGTISFVGRTGASGSRNALLGRFGSTKLADFASGTNGFTAGTASAFGACLRATNASAPVWAVAGTCTAVDGPAWRGVGAAASTVASTTTGASSTADLRFGVRINSSQPPGVYVAPLTFEVVAPSA